MAPVPQLADAHQNSGRTEKRTPDQLQTQIKRIETRIKEQFSHSELRNDAKIVAVGVVRHMELHAIDGSRQRDIAKGDLPTIFVEMNDEEIAQIPQVVRDQLTRPGRYTTHRSTRTLVKVFSRDSKGTRMSYGVLNETTAGEQEFLLAAQKLRGDLAKNMLEIAMITGELNANKYIEAIRILQKTSNQYRNEVIFPLPTGPNKNAVRGKLFTRWLTGDKDFWYIVDNSMYSQLTTLFSFNPNKIGKIAEYAIVPNISPANSRPHDINIEQVPTFIEALTSFAQKVANYPGRWPTV